MTDRTQLHHLADRARRGVLLPAEGALLADAVGALLDRAEQAEASRDRLRQSRTLWTDHAAQLAARADHAEAAIARARVLHRDAYPDHPGQSCTAGCGTWPCPTARALDEQQPTT